MKSPAGFRPGQRTGWYVLAGVLWVSSAALSVIIHDALTRALSSHPWHANGHWSLAHSAGGAAAAQLSTAAVAPLSSAGVFVSGTWKPPEGPRRVLLLTYANTGYSNWMLNWAGHVQRLQAPMLVVALDDETAALCAQHNIPYMVPNEVKQLLAGSSFRPDRAGKFRTFGSLKGKLAAALLKAHNLTAVILSDTDVAWLRDPADLVELQPEADILISTDCLSTKTEMSGVINGNRCGHTPRSWYFAAYNTGVVIARNTPRSIRVLEEWSRRLSNASMASADGGWILTDQLTLNAMWREKKILVESVNPQQGSRVVWLWDDKVKVAPLPGLLISSGQAAFLQHLHQQYSTTPYAVHATFQLKGANLGKIQRFKEAGLWLLEPPEYYTSGHYLTWHNVVEQYVEAVAKAWEEETGAPMQHLHKHLVGMAFQRQVIAEAVSLGHTLNRTVVPPPFLCWCEEDWVADILETCTIPGSDTALPFHCSSDHVLAPAAHWQDYIRLPGFLELPQVPITLRRSQTRLLWAPNATAAAVLRTNLSHALGVAPMGASDAQMQEAAAAMLPARVLHLGPMVPGVVGPVHNAVGRKEVTRRQLVASEGNVWCCAAKEWDKKQFQYAAFPYAPIVNANKLHARLSASSSTVQPHWVPPGSLFQRFEWCESELLLPVNRNYTRYPNHPCTYLRRGVDMGHWQGRLRSILAKMLPQLLAADPDGGLGFV